MRILVGSVWSLLVLVGCGGDDQSCPCEGVATLTLEFVQDGAPVVPDSVEVGFEEPGTAATCDDDGSCSWSFFSWPDMDPVIFDITVTAGGTPSTHQVEVPEADLWVESGCGCGGWTGTRTVALQGS